MIIERQNNVKPVLAAVGGNTPITRLLAFENSRHTAAWPASQTTAHQRVKVTVRNWCLYALMSAKGSYVARWRRLRLAVSSGIRGR